LIVWVVDDRGMLHTTTVQATRARLESLTRRVRADIDPPDAKHARPPGALHARLRELDRLLVDPIAEWLPADPEKPVIVIPYGPLLLLPFAALEDASGRPLIARHALVSAPALSIYDYTGQKRLAAAEHRSRALVVADPIPPVDSGGARLPGARQEGQSVVRHLGKVAVRLLSGADATEAAVKRDVGGYALLHFATHGVIAPERPLASSLLLGAGGGEDGYLRVDEIFNLDLAARLVVLSGCSTGLGQLTGDGVLGLTRAFLYAGTPTVVVSQWNIGDQATAALMDRFYSELSRGRTTAQALRTAALATRARFPQPRSWAAFEVIGEPE
jgi:CHAT domain-containing protein